MGPNQEMLGNSFQEVDAAGNVVFSGSTTITTGNDTAGGVFATAVKYRKEVNEFTDSSGNSEVRTYYFNNDETDTTPGTSDPFTYVDTVFGDFMAGTEQMGAKTTTLGPNWTVVGEQADINSLTQTDLSLFQQRLCKRDWLRNTAIHTNTVAVL